MFFVVIVVVVVVVVLFVFFVIVVGIAHLLICFVVPVLLRLVVKLICNLGIWTSIIEFDMLEVDYI